MTNLTQIDYLQPPQQLMSGFLDFANQIRQKSIEKNAKLIEDELTEIYSNNFPGQIRTEFFHWIGDINRIFEVINIILLDLYDLRLNKNSLKGNPVIRSEFLFQAFFGEFFRIKEISKIFIKYMTKMQVLNNKNKKAFVDFYFKAFDWIYEIRNSFVHQGLKLKDEDVEIDFSFIETLSEKEKFIQLLNESNIRKNTVEIQCAFYMKVIGEIMKTFIEFQELLSNTLADLIISFEKINLEIKVTRINE
ncbi:hypothetical protein ACE01N_19495 [Saccharicrinis sp. FJH2]|uniref:hypothetical protein n=1 Tax=Saccharicrinis sp. FJH65 TaxID=3344659 RepID=UPI0035F4432D